MVEYRGVFLIVEPTQTDSYTCSIKQEKPQLIGPPGSGRANTEPKTDPPEWVTTPIQSDDGTPFTSVEQAIEAGKVAADLKISGVV
jgi:uncharacterized protein with NAD-binding domain and iron-sulfur cluster